MEKLRVAIIGQGRSGKNIHGKYYLSEDNKYYTVRYVVEADADRRAVAKERHPDCEVLADYRELLDKTDIDLVVNASFSQMHFEITKDLLMHKFNVLCEKPLARNLYECDVLINLAKENGVLLAAFQQTFYAPFYQHVLQIMEDKTIGDILEVSIRYNAFSRRWDWQTLQRKWAAAHTTPARTRSAWRSARLDLTKMHALPFPALPAPRSQAATRTTIAS